MPEGLNPFAILFPAVFLAVGGFGLFRTRQWIASWPGSHEYEPRTYTFMFWFARAIAAVFLLVGVIELIELLRLVF